MWLPLPLLQIESDTDCVISIRILIEIKNQCQSTRSRNNLVCIVRYKFTEKIAEMLLQVAFGELSGLTKDNRLWSAANVNQNVSSEYSARGMLVQYLSTWKAGCGYEEMISFILRLNRIENRAISGFSGQKSGTRIILSILQSLLHFWKLNKYLKDCHRKQFPMGTR